jgi:sulfur-oxidizing protein SoxZ
LSSEEFPEAKLRARIENGVTTVRALIKHPMENGHRKGTDGQLIPAHYVQEVSCEHNGAAVFSTRCGPGLSKNPFLSFQFRGAKPGDALALRWQDNRGGRGMARTLVK